MSSSLGADGYGDRYDRMVGYIVSAGYSYTAALYYAAQLL